MRAALLLSLLLALAGCPKAGSNTSGDAGPATWVVFDIYEFGSNLGLSAVVWPEDLPEAGEVVLEGSASQDIRYEGLGRTDAGFALPFQPGATVAILVWTRGHELKRVEVELKAGANLVEVPLRAAAVPADQLPEAVRTDVLTRLPSNIRRGT